MIDVRAVNKAQFDTAKWWWSGVVGVKLFAFSLGAWAVFLGDPPRYLPQIVLGMALVAELMQLRSDALKGKAERLLRKLDICRSFGNELTPADLREVIYDVPKRVRQRFQQETVEESYFASTADAGPRRAVENLVESAWYTGKLATMMARLYTGLIVVLASTAIAALIVSARELTDVLQREYVTRVVTSWLLLIVSLSMLRAVWSYSRMAARCDRTMTACEHLGPEATERDALSQWHEYQVSRASCPLIPKWLWDLMSESLDDAWHIAMDDTGREADSGS